MAGKHSDMTALTGANLASGDLFEVLDVSDTSLAPTGTNKKIEAGELALGLGAPDVQVFTSSGTWTKPAGAYSIATVFVIAGGSGGASGDTAASGVAAYGGAGGSSGAATRVDFTISSLSSTETVTVGAGGAGAAGHATSNTAGSAGAAGGTSSFGAHVQMPGGYFAYSPITVGEGGSAGGVEDSDAPYAGSSYSWPSWLGSAPASGGTSPGGAGGTGPGSASAYAHGMPGGGGGGHDAGDGGDGGAGGLYGGGGGGGGGCRNGHTSGSGGDGADGLVVVICQ